MSNKWTSGTWIVARVLVLQGHLMCKLLSVPACFEILISLSLKPIMSNSVELQLTRPISARHLRRHLHLHAATSGHRDGKRPKANSNVDSIRPLAATSEPRRSPSSSTDGE